MAVVRRIEIAGYNKSEEVTGSHFSFFALYLSTWHGVWDDCCGFMHWEVYTNDAHGSRKVVQHDGGPFAVGLVLGTWHGVLRKRYTRAGGFCAFALLQ